MYDIPSASLPRAMSMYMQKFFTGAFCKPLFEPFKIANQKDLIYDQLEVKSPKMHKFHVKYLKIDSWVIQASLKHYRLWGVHLTNAEFI